MEVQGPHNSYLWLANETGIVGLATYAAFLASIVSLLRRRLRQSKAGSPDAFERSTVASLFAFLINYQLTAEVFGWNIPTFAGRPYFLATLAIAISTSTSALADTGNSAPGRNVPKATE